MSFPFELPARGEEVLNDLAFLDSAADFWIFVSFLCWFLSFNLALEGRLLAHRRSTNQTVWLGGALIFALQAIKSLQELLVFSFETLRAPQVNVVLQAVFLAGAAIIFLLVLPRELSPRHRWGTILAVLALLLIDFGLTLAATNFWARDGLMGATYPILQAALGIHGQVLLSLGVLIFVAWQMQRLRIDQHASHFLTEGLALVAIVAVTFLLCRFLYAEALAGKTSREMELAQNAVLAIPLSEALQLQGKPQDAGTEAYRRVQAHLSRIREANPAIEGIFLWAIHDNELVILAGSSGHHPDVPPGHVLDRASARDLAAYSLDEPWRAGPFRDSRGFITSVNDRITYPGSDRTFCRVQIDFNTRNWLSAFTSRRILVMAAATMLCLLVLGGSNYRLRRLDDIKVERGKQLAAEAERVRLGRDLHDDLGQLLSAINIQSSILAEEFDPKTEPGQRGRELCALTQRAVESTREIARGLVPEDGDFSITFRKYCQQIAHSLSVECEVEEDLDEVSLRREVRVALMRVSQESINNAVKHGKATRIDVRIGLDDGALKMSIADNGSGFRRWERRPGIGTSVMRARIEELGGQFVLDSKPGAGVVVRCAIPGDLIGPLA